VVALYKERPSPYPPLSCLTPPVSGAKIPFSGLFSLLLNAQHIVATVFYYMLCNELE